MPQARARFGGEVPALAIVGGYGHYMPGPKGETLHAKGADGAARARRWLESTTRVNASWVNPQPEAVPKLTFSWPHGGEDFTFDLGGTLLRGKFHGQMFFAEAKNYTSLSDLGVLYREYLAKCYCALMERPGYCDNFMWIAWHPHLVTHWTDLCTAEYIGVAVVEHAQRVLGVPPATATPLVDSAHCEDVAKRLWLIILSERQEELVVSPEHRGLIEKFEIEKAAGSHA